MVARILGHIIYIHRSHVYVVQVCACAADSQTWWKNMTDAVLQLSATTHTHTHTYTHTHTHVPGGRTRTDAVRRAAYSLLCHLPLLQLLCHLAVVIGGWGGSLRCWLLLLRASCAALPRWRTRGRHRNNGNHVHQSCESCRAHFLVLSFCWRLWARLSILASRLVLSALPL